MVSHGCLFQNKHNKAGRPRVLPPLRSVSPRLPPTTIPTMPIIGTTKPLVIPSTAAVRSRTRRRHEQGLSTRTCEDEDDLAHTPSEELPWERQRKKAMLRDLGRGGEGADALLATTVARSLANDSDIWGSEGLDADITINDIPAEPQFTVHFSVAKRRGRRRAVSPAQVTVGRGQQPAAVDDLDYEIVLWEEVEASDDWIIV